MAWGQSEVGVPEAATRGLAGHGEGFGFNSDHDGEPREAVSWDGGVCVGGGDMIQCVLRKQG